ncbi:MAG: 3-isopropylmalate dehydrogenase, partial [Myxococcales bacterium]|nr:3-isopropylmalate dehydrogenase [Myxococcales bacterium]
MTARVVLLPGDGIGAEVTEAARQVLVAAARKFDVAITLDPQLVGGHAIDEVGDPL